MGERLEREGMNGKGKKREGMERERQERENYEYQQAQGQGGKDSRGEPVMYAMGKSRMANDNPMNPWPGAWQNRPSRPPTHADLIPEDTTREAILALSTSVAIPLFSVVEMFMGVPSLFKKWVREVEKYAQIVNLTDREIPNIAHATCSGSVSDFVKRYFEEMRAEGKIPNWKDLKKLLQKRFAEISDSQQAMAVLRKMKQNANESVQIFAERMLRVAEDAFPEDDTFSPISELQLIDIFCDGLAHDYLRMKVLREFPQTLEQAVQITMKEQNLRKRFYLRTNPDMIPLDNPNNNPSSISKSATH